MAGVTVNSALAEVGATEKGAKAVVVLEGEEEGMVTDAREVEVLAEVASVGEEEGMEGSLEWITLVRRHRVKMQLLRRLKPCWRRCGWRTRR